jgi:peptidoglycan/LPS O-acetylase OafA/YrhL
MTTKGRILELDGLRTLAILAVMLYHFLPGYHTTLGWAGVDLFFVLSGFLITGILLDLRSDPAPYRKFYWRRVIRIFPSYYAVVAIIAALALAHRENGDWTTWQSVLFFLPAIRRGISFHLIFHRLMGQAAFDMSHVSFAASRFSGYIDGLDSYWSLAVEELFYLLWAPLILKSPRKAIIAVAIAPLFVCPILRGLTHTSGFQEGFGFVTRLDTLAVGGCVALLLRARPNISGWTLVLPIAPLLATLGWLCVHCGLYRGIEIRSTELFAILGYSLLALLFACVIGACVRFRWRTLLAPLRLWPIVYIGTISYTMYLAHFEIYVIVSKFLTGDLVRGLVSALLTIGVGALSWKYFETPILRLRNWPRDMREGGTEPLAATVN